MASALRLAARRMSTNSAAANHSVQLAAAEASSYSKHSCPPCSYFAATCQPEVSGLTILLAPVSQCAKTLTHSILTVTFVAESLSFV